MKTINRDIVSALIFSKDNKILMGMKDSKSGGVYLDCWHIPGGGMHAGETQEQTLQREILEEVGLDISSHKAKLIDDQGNGESKKALSETDEIVLCKMRFFVYRVNIDVDSSQIKAQPHDDLIKLKWIDASDLANHKLTPPSISLFSRLGLLA